MRARAAAYFLLFAGLCACSHTYEHAKHVERDERLVRDAPVYVARPEPAFFKARPYPKSSEQTAAAIANAFRRHSASVTVGEAPEVDQAALASARSQGTRYLALAEIRHWEDRATEWSGKPDRIRLMVRIYRVDTGRLLDATEISGTSRWATFGGDHPQELLSEPVASYVASLYE